MPQAQPGLAEEIPSSTTRTKKTFVLCFDGTGNKFSGDETDSNILKIYRMLDRADGSTFTFYQPGIGTYVSSSHVQTTGAFAKLRSWYEKSKDAAVGSSFAEHVMGGYRFLMRYYSSEDDLYFFGFSRGAYTARFLAEMLDHVGLLSAGNEELTRFAWKTYAKWAGRRLGDSPEDKEKEKELYQFMRGFRETFSRRVRRIRFLGLFDTVNSVPAFENAWMQRNKFPYTARSSAKVIRHAVSIDERRAKFRQDLVSGSKKEREDLHRYQSDLPQMAVMEQTANTTSMAPTQTQGSTVPSIKVLEASPKDEQEAIFGKPSVEDFADAQEHPFQLDALAQKERARRKSSFAGEFLTQSTEDLHLDLQASHPQISANRRHHPHRRWSDLAKTQDIQEVWFPGGHGDIGGGWKKGKDEFRMLSHTPLVWMVHEAEKAGLSFDPLKMKQLHCLGDEVDDFGDRRPDPTAQKWFLDNLEASAHRGEIHDCLDFTGGLAWGGVLAWKIMEYLPFRRMDLKPDGSWEAIRWPLPCGETRDIPNNAQIHGSAIRRMKNNPKYRPGNLIVGGGGRGIKIAPEKYGIGTWDIHSNPAHPVFETYIRKIEPESDKKA